LPKLPVVSGADIVRVLHHLGYSFFHQRGSHIKMYKETEMGKQIVIVPNHKEIRPRTFNDIISIITAQKNLTKEEVIDLFQ
jgi:predicted RNA binding protein YcfA (HicA-like mRNA interferase family)